MMSVCKFVDFLIQLFINGPCYFASAVIGKCKHELVPQVDEWDTYLVEKEDSATTETLGSNPSVKLARHEEYIDPLCDYVIEKEISAGSFGKVFNATCKNENLFGPIAVKKAKRYNWYSVQFMRKEIEVLKLIRTSPSSHAHLLVMYDHVGNHFEPAFVMERLDIDLDNYMKIIQEWKPLNAGRVADIARQIFKANVALLNLGIIHSDIKLHNIMVIDRNVANVQIKVIQSHESPNTKLIDFGGSVHRSEPELLDVCSVPYCAPEHALGLPLSEKIDSWSLGVVLFELYTGLFPFPARDFEEVVRHMHEITGLPDNYLDGSRFCCFYGKRKQKKRKPGHPSKQRKIPKSDWLHRGFKKLFKYSKAGQARKPATVEDHIICELVNNLLHRNPYERISSHEALHYFKYIKLSA